MYIYYIVSLLFFSDMYIYKLLIAAGVFEPLRSIFNACFPCVKIPFYIVVRESVQL